MKQLSKEEWRKIHGIKEPQDLADPSVVSRRALHESIVQWEIKWTGRLHLASIFIAFTIVLFPAINKTWHEFVTSVAIFSLISKAFSCFGGVYILSLALGVVLHFYSARRIDGSTFSEYGYPINLANIRSAKSILQGDLYPRTRIEEKVFFADFAGGIWIVTAFWFIAFGGISFLIKSGGQ